MTDPELPTVVLGHGARADASGWSAVIARLPAARHDMAERATGTVVEAAASHVSLISTPAEVADLVLTAARAVR